MPDVQMDNKTVGVAGSADGLFRTAADFGRWIEQRRGEVEQALSEHWAEIEFPSDPHSRLPAAVQYSVQAGGKRLRPILVLETCRVCGARSKPALPAALAMEFVHTFSLIHDDLPAMDNDDLRRGQPTNHRVFGDGLAVLAGDWLLAHAFSLLASNRIAREAVPALVSALAAGTLDMIKGQSADLAGEDQDPDGQLTRYIHQNKTAALIETCCRLGATCAGAPGDAVAALARYGRHLGLAFQITDDLLDATGTTESMGKLVGKDAGAGKQTYLAAFGLEQSRAQARREAESALRVLDSFGGGADRLRDLARYVLGRGS